MKINDCFYKIYKFGTFSKRRIKKLYDLMPTSRKERVNLVKDVVYKEFLIVEYFLVIKTLKISGDKDFSYTQKRKPYIENSAFNFSISHSENILMVAFSKKEIGVDIQHILPFDDKMARLICCDEEYSSIIALDKDFEFTKLWTKKESVVKMLGETLYLDTKNILLNNSNLKIYTINKKKYIISICIAE